MTNHKNWILSLLFATVCASCASQPPATAQEPVPTNTSVPATATRPAAPVVPTLQAFPTASAKTLEAGQQPYSFTSSTGQRLSYLLYVPDNFDASTKWPMILFLHGSSERGENLANLKFQYLPQYLEIRPGLPFLIASPQIPGGDWEDYLEPLDELLTHLIEALPVDPKRIYLTGLSLGGSGTWEYALKYPDRFAAIAPMAGGSINRSREIPDDICNLKEVPAWIFHGARDTSVPAEQGQMLADALQACGGETKFTLYPDAGHQATWVRAYKDPELYEWLLQHEK